MLTKKLAIVTGAARGLGFAVARDLALADCKVLMVGRNAAAIALAAQTLADADHDVVAHVADITDADAVAALATRVRREFGRADILINNAGIFIDPKSVDNPQASSAFNVAPEIVVATLASNTLAPLRLIQAIVPLMRETGWGRIVNVSSGMGQLSRMGGQWPGYRISKAALNALTCVVASELDEIAGCNIKINSVCPGWCRTEMGGTDAERSADEGAKGIVWAALLPNDGPSGGFFRDGQTMAW
jgi:NAD(P)-dependent dehydrogenase (short-subunit alcohol dehydrogenase family)